MKNFIGLLCAIILLALTPLTLLLAQQDSRYGLVVTSPEKSETRCINTGASSVLEALNTHGFAPKRDETGFIYSLIDYDGPQSSNPEAKNAFWGFWVKNGELSFSNLGAQAVRPENGKVYVFHFGDGTPPSVTPDFQDVCPEVRPSEEPEKPPTPNINERLTTPSDVQESPTNAASSFNISSTLAYLRAEYRNAPPSKQDWAAIALGSHGQNIAVRPLESDQLLSKSRHILALAAQGQSAGSYVNKIKEAYDGMQFGEKSQINDDIFAILALVAADPEWIKSRPEAFDFIADSQRTNGSFGFAVSGEGDVDMTAAALWALKYAPSSYGTVVSKAFDYLNQAKHADGSFGYQLQHGSNIPSTSWALIAYQMYNRPLPETVNFLEQSRQSDGSWLYGNSSDFISTAYAALALSSNSMPITGQHLTEEPSQTATPLSLKPKNDAVQELVGTHQQEAHTSTESEGSVATATAGSPSCSGSASASAYSSSTGGRAEAAATASASASCN